MNRLFLFLFGMMSFEAHAQVPVYVPTEGLVGWWPLDGNADDESGNGNEGFVYGPIPTADHFGTNNSALLFDGTDDYIDISNTNGLSSSQGLSMAIWFYWEGANGNNDHQYLFLIANNPNGSVTITDDGLCGINVLNCNCVNDINLTTQVLANTWYQVAMTYSLNDGLLKMYLNGELVESSVESMYSYYTTNNPADRFGNYHFNSHFFKGKLNDAGLWNRALNEEEILALYNFEPPVPGCTDSTACNFDAEAMSDNGSCIPSGCMELEACNYNALAECEGEACDYTCCPGPGCCLDGTVWDSELGGCIPIGTTCSGDLDFDGIIGVNDLMALLSTFGTDCPDAEEPEIAEWICGDPVNYHGYDYATVQIGEQCWFAENLRTELYQNGDSIPGNLSEEDWIDAGETGLGSQAIYGEGNSYCSGICDEEYNLDLYGRLYNWRAITDERNVCPIDFHIPTDEEWQMMELTIGMPESHLQNMYSWRGTDQGAQLQFDPVNTNNPYNWNSIGFNGVLGGFRRADGEFHDVVNEGYWWTDSEYDAYEEPIYRNLAIWEQRIFRAHKNVLVGYSVRCLKD